jgi:geranylgeranyl diphosphate synthase, type II
MSDSGSQPATETLQAAMKRFADETDEALREFLGRQSGMPNRLDDAIRYSLFAPGKRLRPALVMAWFECVQGRSSSGRHVALAAAGAMELIHTFSLVHDDLPDMDDDDTRRGRPTNHIRFDPATAILAGDAMTTLAFQMLADTDSPLSARLVSELARASGPVGMIGGQMIDIASEHCRLGVEQLKQMHAMKTGALLVCACRLGAVSAGADDEALDSATRFGRHIGLAFQITDDILDVTATTSQLGKASNKDAAAGKNTYPELLGLDRSVDMARSEIESALRSIEPFAGRSGLLEQMAKFVLTRSK